MSTVILCSELYDASGNSWGQPTCKTTSIYGFKCTMGGQIGEDDDEDPTEPRQVDGSWSPPTIPSMIRNPCDQMKDLGVNMSFTTKMTELKNKTTDNFESGYLMKINGDLFSYISVTGNANTGEITLPSNVNNIAGYIHNHYNSPGMLSTFSGTDVRAVYQLYKDGRIEDLKTFTAGVTTTFGTSYAIKVKETSKFILFGSENLNNSTDFKDFELLYIAWFDIFKNTSNEIVAREKALLKILENSGITLLKSNSNFSSWNKLSLNTNNNIINVNCN